MGRLVLLLLLVSLLPMISNGAPLAGKVPNEASAPQQQQKKAKKKTIRKTGRPARQAAPRKRRKSANGDAGASIEQLADRHVPTRQPQLPLQDADLRSLGGPTSDARNPTRQTPAGTA